MKLKLKVGMKFKSLETRFGYRNIGKIYTIAGIDDISIWYNCESGFRVSTPYPSESIQLMIENNEIDWLDAIKDNFRHGV